MPGSFPSRYFKTALFIILGALFVWLCISFVQDYFDLKGTETASPLIGFLVSSLFAYKYVMLFVLSFLAGLIIPIPLLVLHMAVGAFASQGLFDFNLSLIISTIGNAAGDVAAYFFFRIYGHRLLHDQYVQKYSFFLRLEQYFKSQTVFSIFVSRIIGIFGTPVNFLSGYMKVNFGKFLFVDLVGNLVFGWIFLELGYIVGDRWINFSDLFNNFMSILSVVTLFFVLKALYKGSSLAEAN